MQSAEKSNAVTWYVIDCASRRSSIISAFPFILSANSSTSSEEVLSDPEAVILHSTDNPDRLCLRGQAILNRQAVAKAHDLMANQDYTLKVGNDLFILRGGQDLKKWRTDLDVTKWFLYDLQKQSYENGGPFSWSEIPQKAQGRDPHHTAVVPRGLEEGFLLEHFLPAQAPPPRVVQSSPESLESETDDADARGVDTLLVCPTCRHYFDKGMVMHIASDPDPRDPELAKVGLTEPKRFWATRFDDKGHGIDPKGKPCEYVACPQCHRRLPQSFLDLPHYGISTVGATKSGKSYYLTVMSREAQQILATQFDTGFVDDPHTNGKLIESRTKFYNAPSVKEAVVAKTQMWGEMYDRVLCDGQEVSMPHPLVFSVTPRTKPGENCSLVFYDHAGENYQPSRSEDGIIDHVTFAKVILFLFDPAIDTGFRKALGSSEFLSREFRGKFTSRGLLEVLIAGGMAVPNATTEIESLNRLLRESSLHERLKELPLPDEAKELVERVSSLSEGEHVQLNRLILEAAYPQKCPKKELSDGQLTQKVTSGEQQEVMLWNMVDRVKVVLGIHAGTPLDIPLGILVGKHDMWKDLEVWKEMQSERPLKTSVRNHVLDMDAIHHNSELVHDLMMQLSPGFAGIANTCAREVVYFAVSNFGHTPVKVMTETDGETYAPDPKKLKPFNVEGPLVWALSKIRPNLIPLRREQT